MTGEGNFRMKIYIYGIIDSNGGIDESIRGVKGAPIQNIPYRDMGIVVSRFDEMKGITKINALEHEDVLERLMKRFTVLPLKFRTLFNREEDFLSIMEDHYGDFWENLDRLRNKAEFGIKVIWPGDRIRERIERDYCKTNPGTPEASDPPGNRYIEEKFEKYQIEKEFEEKAEICISIIDNFLNRFAAEKKLEKSKSRDILLNAFYLVEKGRQKDFKEAFEVFKIAPGGFNYKLLGPLPPYDFVKIDGREGVTL